MNTKIHLQVGSNIVSVEGSEAFAKSTIEEWSHLLNVDSAANSGQPMGNQTPTGSAAASSVEIKYENVFDEHNGELKIIQSMPGTSKAEATRNTALVLLYGKYLAGKEVVSAEELKAACIDQGCYDNKNFASNLKSLKEKVVLDPKPGGDYTVKLTAPGRKVAKELVENLNGGKD